MNVLRHMPVGDGHEDRRPADRVAIVVEERVQRMGGDRHRELGVAKRLEPQRPDHAVLAAGAADLDLVDVVEQRGRLDQRAVHRDRGLGHQPGGRHGDASHALGVDDDAVGQPGAGQQATGGVSVGNGHGPMLPAPARPCTATGAVQPASVRTRSVTPSVTTSTSPSRSVRNTAIPGRDASVASVSGAG